MSVKKLKLGDRGHLLLSDHRRFSPEPGFGHLYGDVIVLDLVSQVHDVVLMNVYLDLGNPGGSGFWKEGYMGKGREMGRSVYEQPGNKVDRILSQQGGFQVSKGRRKGSKRE
jgi:hypothetical protein